MGFSENDGHVRCEIFRDRDGGAGKWYSTVALNMSEEYDTDGLDRAIENALRRQLNLNDGTGRLRFDGMWAVVFDPYHKNDHPFIVRVPTS